MELVFLEAGPLRSYNSEAVFNEKCWSMNYDEGN
jgi:hypothetical protein